MTFATVNFLRSDKLPNGQRYDVILSANDA